MANKTISVYAFFYFSFLINKQKNSKKTLYHPIERVKHSAFYIQMLVGNSKLHSILPNELLIKKSNARLMKHTMINYKLRRRRNRIWWISCVLIRKNWNEIIFRWNLANLEKIIKINQHNNFKLYFILFYFILVFKNLWLTLHEHISI